VLAKSPIPEGGKKREKFTKKWRSGRKEIEIGKGRGLSKGAYTPVARSQRGGGRGENIKKKIDRGGKIRT